MDKIETQLVLDLDAFRSNLAKAKGSADASGKSFGTKLKSALSTAKDAAVALGFSMEGLRSAYEAVNQSIDRIAARSGADNPAVAGFREVQRSASQAFDTLIEGVLRSSSAQRAMEGLTSVLEGATEEAAGFGRAIDEFVQTHSEEIIGTASVLIQIFAQVGNAFNVVRGAFEAVTGAVVFAAGKVVQGVGLVIDAVGTLAAKVGADELSQGLKSAGENVQALGGRLAKLGEKQVMDGVNRVIDAVMNMEGAYFSAQEMIERFQKFVLGINPDEATRPDDSVLSDRRVTDPLMTAFESVASGATEIFSGAVKTISETFRGLADDLENSLSRAARTSLRGVSSLLDGVAALGVQYERAFGKSNAAAQVFKRVQLGVQAAIAGVNAAMEFGEAAAKNAAGNQLAAAGHLLAAGLFASAAGLAGAQAGGLIGGSRANPDLAGPQIAARAEEEVVQRTTNITFVINGNLIDNDDYVRRVLIPALNRQVEEEDVVLVATHAQTAGTPTGSPRA